MQCVSFFCFDKIIGTPCVQPLVLLGFTNPFAVAGDFFLYVMNGGSFIFCASFGAVGGSLSAGGLCVFSVKHFLIYGHCCHHLQNES